MGHISEIALRMKLEGLNVLDLAKELGYKNSAAIVSQVINGAVRNKKIEKELIKRGFGTLLVKIQTEKGTYDDKRHKLILAEIEIEKEEKVINGQ